LGSSPTATTPDSALRNSPEYHTPPKRDGPAYPPQILAWPIAVVAFSASPPGARSYGKPIQMLNVVRLAAPEKVIEGMSVK
jgi:hypothetical protein